MLNAVHDPITDTLSKRAGSFSQGSLLGGSTRDLHASASSVGPSPNSTPSPLLRSANLPILQSNSPLSGSFANAPLTLGTPAIGCAAGNNGYITSSREGSPPREFLITPANSHNANPLQNDHHSSPSSPVLRGKSPLTIPTTNSKGSNGAKWTIADDDSDVENMLRGVVSNAPDIRRVLSVGDDPLTPAQDGVAAARQHTPDVGSAASPVLLAQGGMRVPSILSTVSSGPSPNSSPRVVRREGSGPVLQAMQQQHQQQQQQQQQQEEQPQPAFTKARPPSLNPSLFTSGSIQNNSFGRPTSTGPLLAGATEQGSSRLLTTKVPSPRVSAPPSPRLLGMTTTTTHTTTPLQTQGRSPTSPLPSPYDSEGDTAGTLCCSVIEQHLRLSPVVKTAGAGASHLYATFVFAGKGEKGAVDMTTKVRVSAGSSPRAVKGQVLAKIAARHELGLDPEMFTLRRVDPSLATPEYLYGDSALRDFAFIDKNQKFLDDPNIECCRLQLVPVDSFVDIAGSRPGAITVAGKSIKLRRRSGAGTSSGNTPHQASLTAPFSENNRSPNRIRSPSLGGVGGSAASLFSTPLLPMTPQVVRSTLQEKRISLCGGEFKVALTHRHFMNSDGVQTHFETKIEENLSVEEILALLNKREENATVRPRRSVTPESCHVGISAEEKKKRSTLPPSPRPFFGKVLSPSGRSVVAQAAHLGVPLSSTPTMLTKKAAQELTDRRRAEFGSLAQMAEEQEGHDTNNSSTKGTSSSPMRTKKPARATHPHRDDNETIALHRDNNSFSFNPTPRDEGDVRSGHDSTSTASPRGERTASAGGASVRAAAHSLLHLQTPLLRRENTADFPTSSTPAKRARSQTMGGGRKRGFTESGLVSGVRTLVSKKKIRFKEGGYDLDLTYISDRIIAMGYPSIGKEAYYRNKMEDVETFFEENHAGSYKVYNLCEERTYALGKFAGSVARYPFFDHCPPPFHQMIPLCEDVAEFLGKKPENVVSIHCKAGKGRTGTMICAYLLYAKECRTAEEALHHFGQRRTSDGKGVTIPSQIRYVRYFEQALRHQPDEKAVIFQSIKVHGVPRYRDGGYDPFFTVHRNSPENPNTDVLYDSRDAQPVRFTVKDCELKLHRMVVLRGDVQLQFFHYDKTLSKAQKMFQCFFNTSFLPPSGALLLPKSELDKAAKDKDCKYFDANFAVCHFVYKSCIGIV